MNCIIEGIDFYNLEAMKYYSPSTSWSEDKKKQNAKQNMIKSIVNTGNQNVHTKWERQ